MKRLFSTLLAGAACAAALAQPAAPRIEGAWARATVAAQRAGGAFLRIDNAGRAADRLVGGAAPAVAESVELHTMTMDGDVMRMRQLDAIELPAGQAVELKPGGLHVMLMGLKAPLKAGETFTLELRFDKAGTVAVPVRVQAAAAMPAEHGKH